MNDAMNGIHVGEIIRNIIPSEIHTTKAAKMLKTSRANLSNLLNGNRDLSVEMATKIEDVFYYKAVALLEHQARYKLLIYRQTIGSAILPVRKRP